MRPNIPEDIRANLKRLFVLSVGGAKGFDSENLIFDSIRAAKRFLDTLLAADTPEIPLL
jgi:hypothetical protein